MEQKQITPFEELHAMLLFATEQPFGTVGQVKEHLIAARHSLDISIINQGLMNMTINQVIARASQEWGGECLEVMMMTSLMNHAAELCETEQLAIGRDIIVMESFLMFMDAAAGGEA